MSGPAAATSPSGTAGGTGDGTARGWADAVSRASAIALLVVLPVQVVATVLVDDPGGRTAADALGRWDSPGWRALDWLLVCLGLVHGALGLVRVVEGSRLRPAARTALVAVLGAAAALLAAAMTLAVLRVGR